jgi:peptide/nickel transport system ATP-binding protein
MMTTGDDDILLRVEHLSVNFPTDDGMVHAVRDLSFTLDTGEILGVVGESGSGKSVSAMATMGLLPKTSKITGSIRYRGQELVGMRDKAYRKLRGNDIAMIFQDPMTSLNPVFTVGYQLAEAYRAHHSVPKKKAWSAAVDALGMVGIPQPKQRVEQYPHEFSGGMRQRVVIAMAIINEPDLIIADEPTTALDVTVQAQILETLLNIREQTDGAIMMITHDLGVIAGMVDRVQVMYAGTAVESGAVDEVFERPRMPYTVGLIGANPGPDRVGKPLAPISGTPPSLIHLPPGCAFSPRCPLAAEECVQSEPELTATDRPGHYARCVRTEQLIAMDDPRSLFIADDADVREDEEAPA